MVGFVRNTPSTSRIAPTAPFDEHFDVSNQLRELSSRAQRGGASSIMFLPQRGVRFDAFAFGYHTGLAKEMNVPVIALAQLNRGVDLRTDKRPKLADLRESGAIEQDADLVLFLHREDAYDPSERPGEADLIVAKNRNGPTGMVGLTWIPESMRFENRSNLDEPAGGWIDGPANF